MGSTNKIMVFTPATQTNAIKDAVGKFLDCQFSKILMGSKDGSYIGSCPETAKDREYAKLPKPQKQRHVADRAGWHPTGAAESSWVPDRQCANCEIWAPYFP